MYMVDCCHVHLFQLTPLASKYSQNAFLSSRAISCCPNRFTVSWHCEFVMPSGGCVPQSRISSPILQLPLSSTQKYWHGLDRGYCKTRVRRFHFVGHILWTGTAKGLPVTFCPKPTHPAVQFLCES